MSFAAAVLTFLLILAIGLVGYSPAYRQHYDTCSVRLRGRRKLPVEEKTGSIIAETAAAIGKAALAVMPSLADARTLGLLSRANFRRETHLQILVGVKVVSSASLGVLIVLSSSGQPLQMLLAVPTVLVALTLPNFFVASWAEKRKGALIKELSTVLDLMVISAQAGLGLLMCIDKVAKEAAETCPCMADELQQLLAEVRTFGKSTAMALADLGRRNGVDELSGVTSTLIACEAKGSDISYPLMQQAESIRDRIKRKREEEASKTPVKMVPVIMIFIMPLILCPMLGPAILIIAEALGPSLGGR